MKQTVNFNKFSLAFENMGRGDDFSDDALRALFDYFEDINENMELDVIAICCEYSEDTYADVAENYSLDISDCADDDEIRELVIDYLNNHTSVVAELDDTIVYAQF